jgi:hypothetical protein
VRSIDAPRDRPAPRRFHATSLSGDAIESEFDRLSLVLAVKEDCMGCRSVIESSIDAFGDVAVVIVARTMPQEPWWSTSAHRVVVSESLLEQLDIRWPPFYVLIDPVAGRVVTEGVVFAPEQVREDIEPFLM